MTRLRQSGVTIIEMLIAMLIGSMLVIAVMLVLGGMANGTNVRPGAEGSRRSLGSMADLDQSASIAMFQVDKWTRSAGTGLGQTVKSPNTYSYAYGCKLFAAKSGTQLLPAGTLPAPFASIVPSATAGEFRLLPALIIPGGTTPNMTSAVSNHTSDVLVLMSSGNGYGEVPLLFTSTATSSALTVPNTTAFSGTNVSNLALISDSQPATSTTVANCMVTQVNLGTANTGAGTSIPLGGSWATATIGSGLVSQAVASYSSSATVLDLGDPSSTSTQPPSFQVIGVGDNDTLYAYDLLNIRSPQLQAKGQNVFELHALYGVDTTGDGVVDSWVSAGSGSYTVASLTSGTIAASSVIKSIKAVRIGLILRTDLPEASAVTTSNTLTLFSDLAASSLSYTRTLSGSELNYRYRTVEATIPIRNNSF